MVTRNYLRFSAAILFSGLVGCSSGGSSSPTCQVAGQNVCSTPTGLQCFDTQNDAQHCGAACSPCQVGQTCTAGVCVTGGMSCGAPNLMCGATCANPLTDSLNCGACGNICIGGKTCQAGVCQCAAGSMDCTGTGVCSPLASDPLHCGNCATACTATAPLCNGGLCSSSCSAGLTQCGSSCVSALTDLANCGTCGHACPANNSCTNGVCVPPVVVGVGGATSVGVGGATSVIGQGGATSVVGQGGATSVIGVGGATAAKGGATGAGGATTAKGGATGTGGSTAPGSTLPAGTRPPGYFYTKDWSVTSADWHGCVWTGIDSTVAGSTTTITSPAAKDYTTGTADGGPYRVAGTVHNAYESVAMIGFNLNEAITGSSTQCKYNASATTASGPPAATIPASATGIAVNWTSTVAPPTSFRIQIQGVDGATNAAHRWCATITDTGGPSFIPFTSFYTNCWNVGVANPPATAIPVAYAKEAIDAVVFLVPGTVAQKAPFDFTIGGFAPGTSKADAPGPAAACGTTTGSLGSTTASTAASMQRAKVSGTDCKQYILFNNNWGQPTSTTQIINFTGNSFTVQSSTATVSGNGVPGSFPSVYIGANGDIAGGTYSTWSDSGLPKQISAISSVQTSLTWSGGTSGGDYNTTYDVWFAKTQPTAGGYNDGISGLLMVWLYKPGSRSPIGSVKRTATIAGHSWDVWVGPRGVASTGTDAAGRPVVSYVAKDSPVMSLSFDLKAFIDDAVTNGAADMAAGGTSQAFSSSWYLTDVFGGFEIWGGGSATGLKETFTCVVK